MKFLLLPLILAGCLLTVRADDAASAGPSAAAASAPDDPVKDAEIRKMITNSGVEATMKRVMGHMFDTMKAKDPSIPQEFWDRIEKEMNTEDLITQLIPVYAKYYSLADLQAINGFLESPSGRHMIEVQPQISTEAMQIGEQWGGGIAQKVLAEMQEEKKGSAATPSSVPPPTPAPAPGH
jgi:hypothetical protein